MIVSDVFLDDEFNRIVIYDSRDDSYYCCSVESFFKLAASVQVLSFHDMLPFAMFHTLPVQEIVKEILITGYALKKLVPKSKEALINITNKTLASIAHHLENQSTIEVFTA